jgi:glycosyltransferase involved in cell wall biosynthesis
VAAVTPGKGHDALVAALARVTDRPWRCLCVGPLTRSPEFVATLRRQISGAGLAERIVLAGPRTGRELEAAYAAADALVLASRAETYGMVVTEALARGLPVLAWDVGGVSEALGVCPDGSRPGVLVPAADVSAFGEALGCWLGDAALRRRLRAAAARRRTALTSWAETAARVSGVLERVAA